MRVHIVRSAATRPGEATWTALSVRELLLFVSSAAVTPAGADTLAFMWAHFIDSGEWRFQEEGGEPIFGTYRRAHPGELPDDVEAEVIAYPDGRFVWALHPDHFTADGVRGIQRSVRDSIDSGWRYYPPPEVIQLRDEQQRYAS